MLQTPFGAGSRTARTRVKICGITRAEDALCAARLGADAIGFVFYEPSPRYVTVEKAALIASRLPAFVSRTGLFVNASPGWVDEVQREVGLDLLQFHGEETCATCEHSTRPYIKSIAVRPETDVAALTGLYPSASGVLLDTWQPHLRGGTGRTFDWSLVPDGLSAPVILAGGLTADNVADAVSSVRPYAVDVSGGVEAEKGIKDAQKIAAFIQGVNSV